MKIIALYNSLKENAPKHVQIEFMGDNDCIWVHGRTLKELRTLAQKVENTYTDFKFTVKTMGSNKMLTILKKSY